MARYALVAGIAKYSNSSLPDLSKTATDAAAVAEVLKQHGSYRVTLLNGEVKAKQLADALKTLLREQAVKNEALIYFTGHGIRGVTGVDNLEQPQGFLAASDCNVTKAGEQWIVRDGVISLNNLNQLIRQSDLSNLVVIFDSCHSGEFLERGLVENALTVFRSQQDYYLITACRRFEQSWAKKSEQHSVFTGAFLAGLSQERAGDNGQVTVDRLFDYIASELRDSRQEPIRMGVGRSLTLVQYQPKKITVVVDETCPYQGLQPFGKEQARFFFGREKVVQLLMEKLGQSNFVPIIGASGSGKSSVVRAGLIPQLEKNGWRVLEPILPGFEPLAELKRALTRLFGRTEVREIYALIETDGLRPVIERMSGSERLLLVVDQFEEAFTLCPNEEEKRRFIELLSQAAEIPSSRLAIVTTMRADFLEPCLSYESLTRLIQDEAVYMPPLIWAELEEAIVKPAELQGYRLQTGLLGAILDDVGKEKGCLPLLQFALTELWEQRDRQTHQLRLANYNPLGGVIGALNRHAEQIYESFTEQERDCVKRIFWKLVRTSAEAKDTRQRQLKSKLLIITGDNSAAQQDSSNVLDELIRGRLLVTEQEEQQGEAWVDLAHEALIEGWQRFVQWRQENRQLRRLIDRVEDALWEWQKEPKDENLMMGGLLAQVREKWQELEPNLDVAAREFYQRSDADQRQDMIERLQADRREAEEQGRKWAFLAKASTVLASSLGYETTLASVAYLAVPVLADWCAVDILDEERVIHRLALAHCVPSKVELAWESNRRYPEKLDSAGEIPRVLRTGQSVITTDITDADLVAGAQDAEHLRGLRELNSKSYMIVPMLARGRILGAITFVTAESNRRYKQIDLPLVEDLAHRAALAVDNALLYRKALQSE